MPVFVGAIPVHVFRDSRQTYPVDSHLLLRRGITENSVILDLPHGQIEVSRAELMDACDKIWQPVDSDDRA